MQGIQHENDAAGDPEILHCTMRFSVVLSNALCWYFDSTSKSHSELCKHDTAAGKGREACAWWMAMEGRNVVTPTRMPPHSG